MKHHIVSIIFTCLAAGICGYLAKVYADSQPCPLTSDTIKTNPSGRGTPTHVQFLVFNTPCQLTAYDKDQKQVDKAFREIMDQLTKLHNTINAYDPDSELSKLNRTSCNKPFKCSPLLWDIIQQTRQAWKLSDGLFDATVGPLLHLWGFHAKRNQLPTEQDILVAKQKVGFQYIQFNSQNKSVAFLKPGMQLDFGGIAKGYALSMAVDIAQKHQLKDYLIDLGGNIYCPKPSPKHQRPYRVGIRNPRQKDRIIGYVELAGQCIATSGNYERQRIIQGKKIGHIMDPRTGRPTAVPDKYESVTAITANPTLSDVFSTTVFVGGADCAEALAKRYPSTAFVFIGFNPEGTLEVFTGGPVKFVPVN